MKQSLISLHNIIKNAESISFVDISEIFYELVKSEEDMIDFVLYYMSKGGNLLDYSSPSIKYNWFMNLFQASDLYWNVLNKVMLIELLD